MQAIWETLGEAVRTTAGFFWKSGWAFVLGYTISAAIQAFAPQKKLIRYMGAPSLGSVSISTAFGSISSSCSFAALAAARSLFGKGAHFIAAVAFMFASTNLVIELGILIFIFLGWQFLVAELIGGLLLITISSLLIKLTYPQHWIDAARAKVEEQAPDDDEDFDWRRRISSLSGWARVGQGFFGEWAMVWREILVGFTLAGLIAVFVPDSFWKTIFLAGENTVGPASFWIVLGNAMVAPFVAAATFIGSMGNIPLATILASSGVLFAGIMGFIYSDLMVPPLVKVNAKYYGWPVALYVAVIMYVSIVCTALALHYGFHFFDLTPETTRKAANITTFAFDYTFWLNAAAVLLIGALLWLKAKGGHADHHQHGQNGWSLQDGLTLVAIATLLVGGVSWAMHQLG